MNNFVVGQVTPGMFTKLGYGTFLVFGIMITLGAGFVWFFTPETSNITLEEMDALLDGGGTSTGDLELLQTIQHEIGLGHLIQSLTQPSITDYDKPALEQIERAPM
ncbi:general substrate transporter [Penicillium angulare]|uniref:general substrate transporter n=1 Tax=Penicillium angulare TaxID=116970 RepID=UPI00253FEDFA|nr:general substrate transporter [Penicillium angulare]KAJ5272301.1 general substrate transporter [Penicillium angulare]